MRKLIKSDFFYILTLPPPKKKGGPQMKKIKVVRIAWNGFLTQLGGWVKKSKKRGSGKEKMGTERIKSNIFSNLNGKKTGQPKISRIFCPAPKKRMRAGKNSEKIEKIKAVLNCLEWWEIAEVSNYGQIFSLDSFISSARYKDRCLNTAHLTQYTIMLWFLMF